MVAIGHYYHRLRRNGDVFVAIALAGCLIHRDWALATLSIYLGALILSSGLRSIADSVRAYDRAFFGSDAGLYYNARLVLLAPVLALLLYHGDGLAGLETPLKGLLAAYVIALNVERIRWPVIVFGAAAGAVAAMIGGLLEIGVDGLDRTGAPIGLVRFGMIAMALGTLCAVGAVRSGGGRATATAGIVGLAAGIVAALISGSRGAIAALPFVLLLLAPALWRRSRAAFAASVMVLALFTGTLLAADVGRMSTRIYHAYNNLVTVLLGEGLLEDHSVGDRSKLLVLAMDLFSDNPLIGAGAGGWADGVERLHRSADPQERITHRYNQAHNQYADDLAKGGLVRFLVGLATLLMPLWLFARRGPYAADPASPFALAGVTVSVAFMIFCLSETLMILGLSSVVHAVLMFSLLRGSDLAVPGLANSPRACAPRSEGRPIPAG